MSEPTDLSKNPAGCLFLTELAPEGHQWLREVTQRYVDTVATFKDPWERMVAIEDFMSEFTQLPGLSDLPGMWDELRDEVWRERHRLCFLLLPPATPIPSHHCLAPSCLCDKLNPQILPSFLPCLHCRRG